MLPIIAVAQGGSAVVYIKTYDNNTTGGSGTSWDDAINGNAYYHYDGSCNNDYKAVSFTGSDREVTSDTRFDRMTFIFENKKLNLILGTETDTKIYLVCRENGDKKFEFSTNQSDATEFYLVPAKYDDNGVITRYYICLKSNPKYKMESHSTVLGTDFKVSDESTTNLTTAYEWKIYKRGNTFYFENGDGLSFGRNFSNSPDGYGGSAANFNKYWTIYDRQKGFQYALVKAKNGSKPSYVFVKEGNYVKTDGNVKARDNSIVIPEGVHLYGSIPNSFTEEAQAGHISEYVEKVKQTRPGMATLATANTTKVGNVMTIETEDYNTETIFDGLYVDNSADANNGTVTINDKGKKKVTLCNSIIKGAATVSSGLLYNSLVENLLTVQKTENVYIANVTYTDGGYNGDMADYGVFFKNKKKSSQFSYYDYQLDETEVDASIGSLLTAFDSFGAINYDTDRDLLGNPRKMGSTVDRGAFEAWCVRDGTVIAEYNASRKDRPWNYYPVANTDVYIMNNSTFVLGDNLPTGYELTPRKLVLKEGAVLYGQGYNVNVSDISVERTIPKDGLIMSLPFAHTYTQGTAYSYSGTDRSAFNYDIKNANSGCWKQKAAPNANKADECEGVFFVPDITGWSSSEKNAGQKVLRFSSTGTAIYTESGASKNVTLTQYDDYTSTYNAADFTSPENMGWNCIGIPYLVNDYKPYRGTDGAAYTSGDYMMQIPHTLWLYYDNTDSYQRVSSWDDSDWNLAANETAKLWFGEGFFTQTAAVSASESLKFYHPVYEAPTPDPSPAKAMANTRHYVASQKEDMDLDTEQSVILNINRSMLTISNLKGDESIDIYTLEGMQKVKTESNKGSYSCTLRPGMYVVKVNDLVRKVMVR